MTTFLSAGALTNADIATNVRLGGAVTLAYALWKGSKPGLFTFNVNVNVNGTGGQADFAWLRHAHDGSDGGAPRNPGPVTAPVNASPNPYGLTSELTVAFTLTADRLTEAVPLGKPPATADGHAGGWAVALHAEGSLDERHPGRPRSARRGEHAREQHDHRHPQLEASPDRRRGPAVNVPNRSRP
ncbi:hypothetical protein ACH47Z_33415 [Streptomyces sp. NPDC020192]|uniref:hypothetical protein n=1 Tax=Streptomyces sp. NPDC020192 TaxID=3365066 RepID=UPI0037BA0715